MIQSLGHLEREQNRILKSLLCTLERKDPETFRHVLRVAELAIELARELGVRRAERERIAVGALLHDIGKLCVRKDLLKTQRILDTQERAHVSEHARLGYALAARHAPLWPYLDIIRDHHERIDGRGYPDHKKEAAISLGARIVAVADAFEVMTSGRGYQPAMSHFEALGELRRQAGKQFCTRCVSAAVSLWGAPAGRRDHSLDASDSMRAALVAMPL